MKADNKEECEEYEKPEGLRGDLAAAILFSFLSWVYIFIFFYFFFPTLLFVFSSTKIE